MRKNNQRSFQGAMLINALYQRATELGLSRRQLAERIGISPSYLQALTYGSRLVSGLGEKRLRRIADFLERSFVQVLMLAEIMRAEDFFCEQEVSLKKQLRRAIANMREHPSWTHFAPTGDEWNALSQNTQIGIALLWELASDQKFLRRAKEIVLERD